MEKEKIKIQCKGLKRDGKRCTQEGYLKGFCLTHYKKFVMDKKKLIVVEVKEK